MRWEHTRSKGQAALGSGRSTNEDQGLAMFSPLGHSHKLGPLNWDIQNQGPLCWAQSSRMVEFKKGESLSKIEIKLVNFLPSAEDPSTITNRRHLPGLMET